MKTTKIIDISENDKVIKIHFSTENINDGDHKKPYGDTGLTYGQYLSKQLFDEKGTVCLKPEKIEVFTPPYNDLSKNKFHLMARYEWKYNSVFKFEIGDRVSPSPKRISEEERSEGVVLERFGPGEKSRTMQKNTYKISIDKDHYFADSELPREWIFTEDEMIKI